MLIVQRFLESLVRKYGKHSVYSDGGTWYPETCKVLRLNTTCILCLSLIERIILLTKFKDRTECFYDYYPCQKRNCNNEHVYNWIELFVYMYKDIIIKKKNNPITEEMI